MKNYKLITTIILIGIIVTSIIPYYSIYNNDDNFVLFKKNENKSHYNLFIENFKNIFKIILTTYTIIISLVIFLQKNNSQKTISWLLIILIFPLLGILLYHFLGQNIRKKMLFRKKENISFKSLDKTADKQLKAVKNSTISTLDDVLKLKHMNLILNNSKAPLTSNNRSKILSDGIMKFKELKKDLLGAKDHIHMEYYIIRNDVLGNEIKDILILKANEGVEVRVIYDSVGSWGLGKKLIKGLKEAGVKIVGFLPVLLPVISREINYRNHRKIVVIDGKIGYLGGINVGDEYLGKDKKFGFWRDTHLKIEGEAVYSLQNIFIYDWYFCIKERLTGKKYFPDFEKIGQNLIQVYPSGPDTEWETVMQSYFSLINYSIERVWIATPYLVPDESINMALKTAALSGIDVRILIPNIADHKIAYWGTHSYIEELLKAGVRIYKYKNGFLHSKNFLVDDIISSIGTANLDYRSFLIDFEVNAIIYDKDISEELKIIFLEDFGNSEEIKYEEYLKRPFKEKVNEAIGRLLSPLL